MTTIFEKNIDTTIPYTSPYAKLGMEHGVLSLRTIDKIVKCDDDELMLKNIEYVVTDGVLYVKGEILLIFNYYEFLKYFKKINGKPVYIVKDREIYNILQDPPTESNVSVKKLFRKKTIQVVTEPIFTLYQSRIPVPYQVATSSFRIKTL